MNSRKTFVAGGGAGSGTMFLAGKEVNSGAAFADAGGVSSGIVFLGGGGRSGTAFTDPRRALANVWRARIVVGESSFDTHHVVQ